MSVQYDRTIIALTTRYRGTRHAFRDGVRRAVEACTGKFLETRRQQRTMSQIVLNRFVQSPHAAAYAELGAVDTTIEMMSGETSVGYQKRKTDRRTSPCSFVPSNGSFCGLWRI